MNVRNALLRMASLLPGRPDGTPHRPPLQCLGRAQTLEHALQNHVSLARFGDGEMEMVLRYRQWRFKGIRFQKADTRLSVRLGTILRSPPAGLLLCFNHTFAHQDRYGVILAYERTAKKYDAMLSIYNRDDVGVLERKRAQAMYAGWLNMIEQRSSASMLGEATCFILSCFYDEYVDNTLTQVLQLYQRMFQDQSLVIVAPETPLMGDSFRHLLAHKVISSPKHVSLIPIPARDCFSHYEAILAQILACKNMDAVMIQAGPTATALVAELTARYGIVAYDVGSLNVSLAKAAARHHMTF